jgi:hypothetical protein
MHDSRSKIPGKKSRQAALRGGIYERNSENKIPYFIATK